MVLGEQFSFGDCLSGSAGTEECARRHTFAHLRPAGLRLNSIGVKFPSCWSTGWHRAWLRQGDWGADGAPRAMRRGTELAALGAGRSGKLGS